MSMKYKIISIPVLLIILTGIPTFLIVANYTKIHLTEFEKQGLHRLAKTVLHTLPNTDGLTSLSTQQKHLDPFIDKLGKQLDSRISVINSKGEILADSKINLHDLLRKKPVSAGPEITSANRQKYGYAIRYSSTQEAEILYVAIAAQPATQSPALLTPKAPFVIRVSRPLSKINASVLDMQIKLLGIGSVIFLGAIALGYLGAGYVARLVQRQKDDLADGIERRTKEISTLQMLSSLLNACTTIDEAARVMERVIPLLLPNMCGGVSILKSSRNRLDIICTWGGNLNSQYRFTPEECWALRKGHQHQSPERDVHINCHHWHSDEMVGTLCIPLHAQGDTIGALHFETQEGKYDQFNHLWEAIAEQIGLTLANIQLRQDLREQAIRDPLTDLYNRRYMIESLEQTLSRAERNGGTVAVMMVDTDHFKRFNDNYGHDAGDHVLKVIANTLRHAVRQEDIACRYGGEEFCVVCPDIEPQCAKLFANRVRMRIRELELSMNKLALGNVSVSIGVALFPQSASTSETLVKAADEALYAAKDAGRDQVILYDEEHLPPALQKRSA